MKPNLSEVTFQRDAQGQLLAMHGGDHQMRHFACAALLEDAQKGAAQAIEACRSHAAKLGAIQTAMQRRLEARRAIADSNPKEFRGTWSDGLSYHDGDVVLCAGAFHQRINGEWWVLAADVVFGRPSSSPGDVADADYDQDLHVPEIDGEKSP